MAICVKKVLLTLLICSLCYLLTAAERFSAPAIINADGSDLVFRAILIEKSLNDSSFKCTVTQDTFDNAVKKLEANQCDMVLVKKSPELLTLSANLDTRVFAVTPILIFVNSANKVNKLTISDLRQIWNGDIAQWSFFDRSNIFSIHRFAMPSDDSTFKYLQHRLSLRDKAQHFPLDTTQQTITIVGANPNAIGIGAFEKGLTLKNVKLIQMVDENGSNINFNMPHTVIFRRQDKNKVENFLKTGKK